MISRVITYLSKCPSCNKSYEMKINNKLQPIQGFPGSTGELPACHCSRHERCRFTPGLGRSPRGRPWKPTEVFLPGESHGQRSLVCSSPQGQKESDTTEATYQVHTQTWLIQRRNEQKLSLRKHRLIRQRLKISNLKYTQRAKENHVYR